MHEVIEEKINGREFTFMELLKIEDLASELANETYEELNMQSRLEFAWEVKITASGEHFGELFRKASIEALRSAFASGLKQFMENAKVTSQSVDLDTKIVTSFEPPEEKIERIVPTIEELVQPEDKIHTTFEEKKDGTILPKGVERI